MEKLILITLFSLSLSILGEGTKKEIVAYLYNVKGKVSIMRGDKTINASSICSELQVDDKVIPKGKSSAVVSYPEKSFTINSSYTVIKPKEKVTTKREQTQLLAKADRLKAKGLINPELLRLNIASVVRKDDQIYLLSPSVKSFSLTPVILLNNKLREEVTISLYEFMEDHYRLLSSIKTSKQQISWKDTNWAELELDKSYQIKLFYNNSNNKRQSDSHSFCTLPKSSVTSIGADWESMEEALARELTKACTLFKYDCLGDTYQALSKLLLIEPENQFLLNFQKRCLMSMSRSSD